MDKAREQAKIDMEQEFIDTIVYSDVKLTNEEINECFELAKAIAKRDGEL